MKLVPLLIVSSLVLGSAMASPNNFIRQIQMVNGANVVVDFPVEALTGEVISQALVADMSVFQLYATHIKSDNTSELIKLDEKSVGTFLPHVTLETFSEDPHVPTCTRADRPYGVRTTVSGMLEGDLIPDYAKSVLVGRSYKLYSPNTYTPTGEEGEYANSHVFRSNGTFTDPAILQRLPVASPTRAVGVEITTAYTRPEAGTALGELASAEVIVWPVATASIDNLQEGATYFRMPRLVSITLRDAYPRSTTYAQIYKGHESLGTQGTVLPHTVTQYGHLENSSELPQNTWVALGDLSSHVPDEGEYTIEVLTITPFNNGVPERLAHVSFVIHRAIKLRCMMVTGE